MKAAGHTKTAGRIFVLLFLYVRIIPRPLRPLCRHSSRIPGIRDEAFSVRGTADRLRSSVLRASSWRGAGRGGPWKSCALVLPFDFHLRGMCSFSEIHAMG